MKCLTDRRLIPELLDSLPAHDSEALRSRRDLRLINSLMGNDRWIVNRLRSISKNHPLRVFELGAGDGTLCRKIAAAFPAAAIQAFDLQPDPGSLGANVRWMSGDIRGKGPPARESGVTTVLVSNMFLHHFRDEELPLFIPWFGGCDYAFVNEPLRSGFAGFLGLMVTPLCNRVTRHDMHASIRAGFRDNELAELVGLDRSFAVEFSHHWRGAYRAVVRSS